MDAKYRDEMYTLVIIFGIICAALIFWNRIQYERGGVKDIGDVMGGTQKELQHGPTDAQAEVDPIQSVDNPIYAAAILMTAIAAEDREITPQIEERLKLAIAEIAKPEDVDAAVEYANWASAHVTDVPQAVDHLAGYLETQLNGSEKVHLIELVQDVAGADTPPAQFIDRLRQLRKKLGLVVN